TPADEEHHADRRRFAALLAKDAIGLVDPAELATIWTTRRYRSPGPQAVLNTTLRDADPAEYDRILDSVSYLCWGEGEDADRIDDLLDPGSPRYVRGLGESVIMKLLAITHPDRYIAVFPYSGPNGKRRMLAALGLEQPQRGQQGTGPGRGQRPAPRAPRPVLPQRPVGDGAVPLLVRGARGGSGAGRRRHRPPGRARRAGPRRPAVPRRHRRPARGQGAGDLLRAARNRQDLPRPQARRSPRARPDAPIARPVPPVDVVRGLLRGLPPRGRCRRADDLPARPRPPRPDRRPGRRRPRQAARHDHRRDQPGQPAQGARRAAVPLRVPRRAGPHPVP